MTDALRHLHTTLSASITHAISKLATSLRLYRGRGLALLFVPLLLAIIANGLLALHSLDTLVTSERVVSRSHAVQAQIHTVEARLVDTESALRGYLLTGDTTYLAPYAAARSTLTVEISRLGTLTAGDATQQRRVAALEPQIAPLLNEWQRAVDLRRQQRTAESIATMRSSEVQQSTDSIHALLAEMDGTEESLLDSRLREAGDSVVEAQVTMLVATIAAVALLSALFVLVWRAFAARERHLQIEREARAAAEAAVVLRDEFLSIASHELRTPVAVVLGNTQLIERLLAHRVERDERIRRGFDAIHRQLARLQALIATMLDVSRIESGQLTIARERLDLIPLARAVVDEVRPTTQAHSIELVVPSDPPHAIVIRGDALRLEQVLLNLLQNSIKYSPDGGPIRVEVTCAANEAVVSVSDYGLGIPEEALPHVFERFYRAPTVRSEHISGMGIGLYIVHEIVALHGGTVTVASEYGAGTTFTVRLPLAASQSPD
ncbi:MAG TPA: ATP-binding protein [Ktedonobacterales bacterium]|nr:ATP-binding protein [Ktedonobacterales bacterium]